MRILHFCHADAESGAGRAAYRLHSALRQAGIDSRMLVGFKRSGDPSVSMWGRHTWNLLRSHLDKIPSALIWPKSQGLWSNMMVPRRRHVFADGWVPTVLNLHWLGAGFGSLSGIRSWQVPEVWTLHDMRHFTGGCHYTGSCDKFVQNCGACPVLDSRLGYDLSSFNQNALRRHFHRRRCLVVAPSRWMGRQAARSRVLAGVRIEHIPNGLDLQAFHPCDRFQARKLLNLPPHIKLIGFGAMQATSDGRKGFDLLESALHSLKRRYAGEECHLVVFGGSKSQRASVAGFDATFLGFLKDDISLTLAYSAIDVLVVPSREDNLPQAPIEALACGTPSIAFAVGGLGDIIRHRETGWLAHPFDTDGLADGIAWALSKPNSANSHRLRAVAEAEYIAEKQARSYIQLYANLGEVGSTLPGIRT